MTTAVDDGLIRRNPCRVKGAGQEDSPERPVISVPTLLELLDQVPPRYRALLLLATFASLRFGNSPGCGGETWTHAPSGSLSQPQRRMTGG